MLFDAYLMISKHQRGCNFSFTCYSNHRKIDDYFFAFFNVVLWLWMLTCYCTINTDNVSPIFSEQYMLQMKGSISYLIFPLSSQIVIVFKNLNDFVIQPNYVSFHVVQRTHKHNTIIILIWDLQALQESKHSQLKQQDIEIKKWYFVFVKDAFDNILTSNRQQSLIYWKSMTLSIVWLSEYPVEV